MNCMLIYTDFITNQSGYIYFLFMQINNSSFSPFPSLKNAFALLPGYMKFPNLSPAFLASIVPIFYSTTQKH